MQCPECQNECPDGSSFCSHCGAVCDSGKPHPSAARGERKQVTVLFADLSGYTAMTEALDAEDVKEIMGRIFARISRVIARYEGTIEKFVGDSVMAVFGVPRAHEDDPARAIRAAREIHDLVAALSPQVEKRIGRALAMHSGINTGLVVTGATQRTGTQGLVGDTINLAARLQGVAGPDEILVGEETCRLAAAHFSFQAIEPMAVKGKAAPVSAYKVLSAVPEPAGAHRLQGVRAELVGREEQMAILADAVSRLKSGQGAIISIAGNAGTGKSRLTRDFKATLDLKQIQWHEGHAYPYTQNTPYYPLINLLTHAFQIKEGDTPQAIRGKVADGIKTLLWNRPDIIPYAGGLFSLRYPETEDLSPEFRREKLKQAIADILEALARRGPTILLIEDLHWADSAFLQLLHQLMVDTRLPMLFILVYRPVFTLFPDKVPDNLAWPYQKFELHDLSPQHTRRMLASLLKARQIPPQLESFVQDKVEGNPFYLEEVVNSLIESKLLVQQNGQWTLTGPITQAAVPSTIQGVLTARLDRLESESKRILQEASVIGRAFYFEVLNRISDLGAHLPGCLSGLEKLDLIRARSLTPDLEYIFKHALTQEVVYNGLLKKERRVLHERIATVMESLFADRVAEFHEILAHHFQRGQSIDKAIDYLIKSGYKAQGQFCLEEAYHYYQDAYELLKSKEVLTLEEKTTLIDLLMAWAWVAYLMADFRQIKPLLAEHLAIAETIGDRGKYAMLAAWYGWAIYMSGGGVQCFPHLNRALRIAEELDDKRLMAYCCTWLSWAYQQCGPIDKVFSYGQRAIELARELDSDHYLNHKSLASIAYGCGFSGHWKKGQAAGEKALSDGKKGSHLRGMAVGYICISNSQMASGQFAEAMQSAETALATATDPLYEYFAKYQIGNAYFFTGQMEKARDELEDTYSYFNKTGSVITQPCSGTLGGITAISGRLQEGLDRIERAQRYFDENGSKTYGVLTQFLKGMVFAQLAAPQQRAGAALIYKNLRFLLKHLPRALHTAEKCLQNAISTGHEVGAYHFVALSHMELGRMFLAKKKPDKAENNLLEAKRIFSELENDYYLRQVEDYLAKLDAERFAAGQNR
jgi:class 3 adenylate cyclase/tetratricopeptide (TPR) repeat protein